ncbi:uncharacterized protein N7473_011465 [Penicillium subrubescens]|uniref:uncharacterized protein n=1 Tax=Penicillium subrubescens TaxID=1316194 RepID=UPI00254513AE|nr:uncharacterized protein N7473_011465 [Penicillium subrubescens]KAJ5880412.1 hypothetical protein N7473_011465 [Penicillium subrubescens]
MYVINLISLDVLNSPKQSFRVKFVNAEDMTQNCKFVRFLVDCGSVPNNRQPGFLSRMCALQDWGPDEYAFAVYLINLGGPLRVIPYSAAGKRNMRGLLDRDDELVEIPDIAKIILRKSEADLRKALESGSARPNDCLQGISSLALAIGWPAGVRILLEFGADATKFALGYSPSRPFHVDDTDCDLYYHSVVPLLQAGCILESLAAFFVNGGSESEEQIPDVHAFQISTELLTQGLKVEPSLQVRRQDSRSIYHQRIEDVEAWEELYKLGFRGIDAPDANGLTPLMYQLTYFIDFSIGVSRGIECIIWLFEKGAGLTKTLPRSNGTVAHLASSWVIDEILHIICMDNYDNSGRWLGLEARITAYSDALFLVPSVRDRCVCACCPSGCTTFSVALRSSVRRLSFGILSLKKSTELFRQVFQLLVQWTEARPATGHIIIRSLTFNALDLRHTCCTENDEIYPFLLRHIQDQQEVADIREEDHHRYPELERLVDELGGDFDQLGLPIMEFLDNHWHGRMVEYLSKPGSYDEKHIQETMKLGIFLEPHEINIPDVVYYFGSQVEQVTSDNNS